jgi:translation elongation factor EF-Tu-like GTPase
VLFFRFITAIQHVRRRGILGRSIKLLKADQINKVILEEVEEEIEESEAPKEEPAADEPVVEAEERDEEEEENEAPQTTEKSQPVSTNKAEETPALKRVLKVGGHFQKLFS